MTPGCRCPRPAVFSSILLAIALSLAACSGGTEPSIPTAVAVSPSLVTFTAIGQTRQLDASVTDQRGDPVDAATVEWTSTDPTVATVSNTGLVRSEGSGTAQITAAVGEIAAITEVSVTQTVGNFERVSGNAQSAAPGAALPQPLVVKASDDMGNPIRGLTVQFAVTEGGGNVQPASAVTGLDGRASTTLTLGPNVGEPQEVTATLPGTAFSVTFSATITSAFNIEVRYLTDPTPAQAQAFAEAEARWEAIITGDLPDIQANAGAGSCGSNSPVLSELIDDLVIFVTLEPIDGPGNILGAAGPCFIRVPGSLPVVGRMRFDTDDLEDIEQANLLSEVILHEMGHVLGVGTLWPTLGLLAEPSLATPPGTDPHFTGAGAIAAFDAANSGNYTSGQKVPVEDTGGEGTADAHWRETVLGNELMTGFISAFMNPLSAITVRSLEDMGYDVNVAGADPFTFDATLRLLAGPSLRLDRDVIKGPIYRVDRNGSVIDVVHP